MANKIFIDTEFIEDGHTIDLISIGMVKETGEEYYAVSTEFDADKASNWVKQNVFKYLHILSKRKPRFFRMRMNFRNVSIVH